jgi:hypothetical protein
MALQIKKKQDAKKNLTVVVKAWTNVLVINVRRNSNVEIAEQ